MKKKLIVALITAAALNSMNVHALADPRKGNPLDALGIASPAGVGSIMVDHENPFTLYVAPSPNKEINGVYAELGSSGPQCADFVNIRTQAYRIPATPVLQEQAYLNGDFVSNWFQLSFAIPRSFTEGMAKITTAREQVRQAGIENKTMLANYYALEQEWSDLSLESRMMESRPRDRAPMPRCSKLMTKMDLISWSKSAKKTI